MRRWYLLALVLPLCVWASVTQAADVDAVVSTRDCYALYIGAATGEGLTLIGGNCTPRPMAPPTPAAWALPEEHSFRVDGENQVYMVVWGAAVNSTGVLAQFDTDGLTLTSGDATWRVVRTGLRRDASDPAPDPEELRAIIRAANVGNTWDETYVGGRNDGESHGVIPEIKPQARWMWASHEPADIVQQAGADPTCACVVFRTSVLAIKPETELFSTVEVGGLPIALLTSVNWGERALSGGGGGGSGASGGGSALGGGIGQIITVPDMWDSPPAYTPPLDWLDPPLPGEPRGTGGGDELVFVDPPYDEPAPYVPDDEPLPPGSDPNLPHEDPQTPEPSSLILLLVGVMAGRRPLRRA